MNIKTMPKTTAAELLLFLADHEEFSSVGEMLKDSFTQSDVKNLFKELGQELLRSAVSDMENGKSEDLKSELSSRARKIISCLSPHEEKTLFKAFGLADTL